MMRYSGSNVLITGGLGFIGSNLAIALVNEGANVTLVDNLTPEYGGNVFNINEIKDKIKVSICDVRDSDSMAALLKDKHYLFNLAAQTSHMESMLDPKTDLDINVTAQISILEACRKVNTQIKIVYASTRQIYGKANYLPVDEKHSINPPDVNGINKFAGEQYHLLYSQVYGINSCILRITNTYGPRMRVKDSRQTFVGIWMRSLIEGSPIKVYGDGMQLRDFNYVDDCVNALLLAGLSNVSTGKIYNLGSNQVVNLKNLAELMITLRPGGSYNFVPFPEALRPIDIGDYYGNFNLISSELGWTPKIELADGLSRSLDFYETNREYYW